MSRYDVKKESLAGKEKEAIDGDKRGFVLR